MVNQTKKDVSAEAQARIDFVRSVVPRRKSRKLVKAGILAVAIILIAGLVWMVKGGSPTPPKLAEKTKLNIPPATSLSSSSPSSSYTSKFFSLGLSYPKLWSLRDNGKGLLQITSPLTNLIADNNASDKGYVTLTISAPGKLPTGLTAGTDLAVLDSAVLTYTSPAADQSGQLYISFLQYSTTNIKGGLDGVYATGNYGYQKGQVVSTSIFSDLNPLIYVTFSDCVNSLCNKQAPLTIAGSSWGGTPLGQIITNIIQSFVFN